MPLQDLVILNRQCARDERNRSWPETYDSHVWRWRDHQFLLNAARSGGHNEALVKDYLEWLTGKVWS